MAVATTLRRPAFNSGYYGTLNLYLVSTTGVAAGIPLTIAGDLVVTTIHERPNNAWKCEVTGTPPGSGRLLLDIGDTVTG
jgi:hypothetical protein